MDSELNKAVFKVLDECFRRNFLVASFVEDAGVSCVTDLTVGPVSATEVELQNLPKALIEYTDAWVLDYASSDAGKQYKQVVGEILRVNVVRVCKEIYNVRTNTDPSVVTLVTTFYVKYA